MCIEEGNICMTSFKGLYEFPMMPFGLNNATYLFVDIINHTFWPLLDPFVTIFTDDILAYSRSIEEHHH